jgi:hypothetical protein
LVGDWRREHLFVLKQSRQIYETYRQQITACDREIEALLAAFTPRVDPQQTPPPPGNRPQRKTKRTAGALTFDHRNEAYKLFGVDVTRIPGIDGIAIALFSEIGRDLTLFPTAAQFKQNTPRGLPATDEVQTRAKGRHNRYGPQTRDYLLYPGDPSNRVR